MTALRSLLLCTVLSCSTAPVAVQTPPPDPSATGIPATPIALPERGASWTCDDGAVLDLTGLQPPAAPAPASASCAPGVAARIGGQAYPHLRDALAAAAQGSLVTVCTGLHEGPFGAVPAGVTLVRVADRSLWVSDSIFSNNVSPYGGSMRIPVGGPTASILLRDTVFSGHGPDPQAVSIDHGDGDAIELDGVTPEAGCTFGVSSDGAPITVWRGATSDASICTTGNVQVVAGARPPTP